MAIGITSTRGVFIEANPALCMLLGYTRAEIVGDGLTPFAITHPESLPLTFQYLSLLLQGKQGLARVDKKYCCKVRVWLCVLAWRCLILVWCSQDGRVLLARLSVWLTRDPSGRPQNLFNLIEPLQFLPGASTTPAS